MVLHRRFHVLPLLSGILVVALSSAWIKAAQIEAISQVTWGDDLESFFNNGNAGEGFVQDAPAPVVPPGVTVAASVGVPVAVGYDDGTSRFDGSAVANATFGSVGVAVHVDVDSSSVAINHATAGASFRDTITVLGGVAGEPGVMNFVMAVHGTASRATGNESLTVASSLVQNPGTPEEDTETVFEMPAPAPGDPATVFDFEFVTKDFNFIDGAPFEIELQLGAAASLFDVLGEGLSGTADGSFANTVSLTGVMIDGNTGGLSIGSDSGTQYEIVPEPALSALILLALPFLRRRAR